MTKRNKSIGTLIFAGLMVVWGIYYTFFYGPTLMKRAAEKSLLQFSQAMATKDRTKIAQAIDTLVTDDAHIKLGVQIISIRNPDIRPITQDFDKPTFITFIDNTLYSMTDYSFETRLKSFTASKDEQSAQLSFSGVGWGDGVTDTWYAGTVINIRYGTLAHCDGQAAYDGLTPRINQLECTIEIRPIPKAGDADTKTPEQLRQMTQ